MGQEDLRGNIHCIGYGGGAGYVPACVQDLLNFGPLVGLWSGFIKLRAVCSSALPRTEGPSADMECLQLAERKQSKCARYLELLTKF